MSLLRFSKNKSLIRQIRNISTLTINNINEQIIERTDYPIKKCKEILNNKTISVLGYGPQGRGIRR